MNLQSITVPDLWQRDAVQHLRAGRDVVVHAPTGAGKTYIFELLYPELKGQAVFTVPTRALANDKLGDWRARGWDVGISTGDLAQDLGAKVVVATLETQRGRFLRRDGPRLLVVDEYQMIGDAVRGVNYELALALAPPTTQLLLLSGSVGNPRDVVAWLRRIGRDAVLVTHDVRPVPLTEVDLETLPSRAPLGVRGVWPRFVANALRADLGPLLLFAPRRNAAEDLAQLLASQVPCEDPLVLSPEQQALAGPKLGKLLRARVAYHHSGIGYALRAGVIEPLAKNGQLRVVVATMGLAAGINFSMRSVAVTDIRYMAGNFERQVQPDELVQMFGRAGRRGLDEAGHVLFTSRTPRLLDARPRHLRRATQLDWPTLIAVMHAAAIRGEEPFSAALELNRHLFTPQEIPLGIEHSRATGPMPCGLFVDMERARFARRSILQMRNSRNEWEDLPAAAPVPLGEAWLPVRISHAPGKAGQPAAERQNNRSRGCNPRIGRGGAVPRSGVTDVARPEPEHEISGLDHLRWRPALSIARTLDGVGFGQLCRLEAEGQRKYGRELILGKRRGGGLDLAPWLRQHVGLANVSQHGLETEILAKFPTIIARAEAARRRGPASILAPPRPPTFTIAKIFTRGDQLVAHLDYSPHTIPAHRDSHGRALLSPETREIRPEVCVTCPELPWCTSVGITVTAAWAWRKLGLIERNGTPTRRGIIFGFFYHGEGLAVAAALEDPTYPIEDLVFDLANLRAGPRFAGDDAPHAGRLGALCQSVYERADFPGYLEMGVPTEYGAGAAEAVRSHVEFHTARSKLLTEWLRPGDIERALIEWRSLLRHITLSPDYDWDRWRDLRAAAQRYVNKTGSPTLATLPPLLASQRRR